MAIAFIGIDLAKNVFAVHGVSEAGWPERVRPALPGARLQELIATLAPFTIGMEACSRAHHWAPTRQPANGTPGWGQVR